MNTPIPNTDQCLAFMDEFEMYDNIRRHSCMVARVAEALHRGLYQPGKTTGEIPSLELLTAGALLHDIAKTRCLEEDCRHDLVGEEICRELGYMEIGEIVRNHVVLSSYVADRYANGLFNAIELVFYADKRVKHDKIVSLDDRLAYILEKYSNDDSVRESYIRKNFQQCQEIEKYLFTCLDFSPIDLAKQINCDLFPQYNSM